MKLSYPLFLILLCCAAYPQQANWDSLNIQYQLLQTSYFERETEIKIKVPPYLKTTEVMEQIRLAVQWPGDPPPEKQTTVYVFRENAGEGDRSKTGGRYIPGKGFKWDLRDWKPDTAIFHYTPRMIDRIIYNTLLDSLLADVINSMEFESKDNPIKKKVAREFEISVAQLDSIYYRVKWWQNLNKNATKEQTNIPQY